MGLNVIVFQKNNSTNVYSDKVKNYNYGTGVTKNIINFNANYTDPTLLVNSGYFNTSDNNLIIYDWSATLNDGQLESLLITLMNTSSSVLPWDVAYLGKWSDTCSKYSVENDIDYLPFTIVNGTDPIGFNAVLLKPAFSAKLQTQINSKGENKYNSINYVIQEIALEETVNFVAFSPNLFVYDPLYNAVDDSVTFFTKTQECVSFNSQVTPPSDNALTIFWILLIILVVCILLWILINSKTFGIPKTNPVINNSTT
jgi:hypothetical protein